MTAKKPQRSLVSKLRATKSELRKITKQRDNACESACQLRNAYLAAKVECRTLTEERVRLEKQLVSERAEHGVLMTKMATNEQTVDTERQFSASVLDTLVLLGRRLQKVAP